MKVRYIILLFLTVFESVVSFPALAQSDTSNLRTLSHSDTCNHILSMDAPYDRPFLKIRKFPITFGGYIESDYQSAANQASISGSQFEFRRFNLFAAATIAPHIKFLAEIAYENDPLFGNPDEATTGAQFALSYAAVDFELHPLFNLRSGLIFNPIGSFNENHDGPKYEFTDRPLAMSQLLPDTWSNAGFELYGKHQSGHWVLGYEFALTGGFDNSIINNPEGKTFLPASKATVSHFTTRSNGEPLYTAKLSVGNDQVGQLGISYMGGVYNLFSVQGVTIDTKRSVNIYDADFSVAIPKLHTKITGEWALIFVTLPPNYTPGYSNEQYGGFIDIVQPVISGKIFNWENAVINLAVRGEYVNWNVDALLPSGLKAYNNLKSIIPAISFRPIPQTVIRLNYRFQSSNNNTGSTSGAIPGFSLGVSTYF